MGKRLRMYIPFLRAGIQSSLAYRANFIFVTFGNLLVCFVSFFLWKATFSSSNRADFLGFSLANMVVYIFVSFFTSTVVDSWAGWNLGAEIKSGDISMRIIKPVNFIQTFLFHELGEKALTRFVLFIPVIIGIELYRSFITGIVQFSISLFFLYIFSLLLAALLNFYINICYGFIAFFIKNLWGSQMMKNAIIAFMSGAIIPIAFFPKQIQSVFTILPFSSVNYTPIMIYIGMYNCNQIIIRLLLQIFWLFVFVCLSKVIWKYAIKRLCVQGG